MKRNLLSTCFQLEPGFLSLRHYAAASSSSVPAKTHGGSEVVVGSRGESLEQCLAAVAVKNTVVLMMANEGALPLMQNMLCSFRRVGFDRYLVGRVQVDIRLTARVEGARVSTP